MIYNLLMAKIGPTPHVWENGFIIGLENFDSANMTVDSVKLGAPGYGAIENADGDLLVAEWYQEDDVSLLSHYTSGITVTPPDSWDLPTYSWADFKIHIVAPSGDNIIVFMKNPDNWNGVDDEFALVVMDSGYQTTWGVFMDGGTFTGGEFSQDEMQFMPLDQAGYDALVANPGPEWADYPFDSSETYGVVLAAHPDLGEPLVDFGFNANKTAIYAATTLGSEANDRAAALFDMLQAHIDAGDLPQIFFRDTNPNFSDAIDSVADAHFIGVVTAVSAQTGNHVYLNIQRPDANGNLQSLTLEEAAWEMGHSWSALGVVVQTTATVNASAWDGSYANIPSPAAVVGKRLRIKIPTFLLDSYANEIEAIMYNDIGQVVGSATPDSLSAGDPWSVTFGTPQLPAPNLHATEGIDVAGHSIILRDNFGDGLASLIGDGVGDIELYLVDENGVESALLASVALNSIGAEYLDQDGQPGVYFDFDCVSEVITVGDLQSDEVDLSGATSQSITRTRIEAKSQVDFEFTNGADTYANLEEMTSAGGLAYGAYSTTAFDIRTLQFYAPAASYAVNANDWTIANKAYVDYWVAENASNVDDLEEVVGMSGSYVADSSATYINAATSMYNADQLLDAAIVALQSDVDQNEQDGDDDRTAIRTEFASADTALSGALMATIAAEVAALENADDVATADRADIRTEFADADTALSGALMVTIGDLESDAAADRAAIRGEFAAADTALSGALVATIAALQSDVDQNEADADAAILVERQRIDALLSGSSVDFDTLKEIVDAYQLADTDILSEQVAQGNRLDVLEGDDQTEGSVAKAEQDAKDYADSLESALSGALTATIAALQSDVDQNEQDGDDDRAAIRTEFANADTALSGALMATIAALQSDVDQNEQDGDDDRAAIRGEFAAADTALSGALMVTIGALESDAAADRAAIRGEFAAADTALSGALMVTIDANALSASLARSAMAAGFAADLANVQAELDATQSGSGLSLEGAYVADASTDYIASAVSLFDADLLLDAAIAAVQSDVDANELFGDNDRAAIRTEFANADTALSGALMVTIGDLESDAAADRAAIRGEFAAADTALHTTISAEIDADVDVEKVRAEGEEAAIRGEFAAADTALSGALVATIAALQSDVDQNEADADAAILVERQRIDALLSGSSVDFDTLKEIVDAYQLADTDILSEQVSQGNRLDVLEGDDQTEGSVAKAEQDAKDYADSLESALSGALMVTIDALQADVDANELFGDNDRAAIRTEFANADTALSGALMVTIDANKSDAAADRAAIRTEFANADTALSGALMVTIAALQSDVDQNEADADQAIADMEAMHDAEMEAMFGDSYVSGGAAFVAFVENQVAPLESSDLHLASDIGDAIIKVEERLQGAEMDLEVVERAAAVLGGEVDTLRDEALASINSVVTELSGLQAGIASVVSDIRSDIDAVAGMTCQQVEVLSALVGAGGSITLDYAASDVLSVSLNGQVLTPGYDYSFDAVNAPTAVVSTFGFESGDRLVLVYKKALSLTTTNVAAVAPSVSLTDITDWASKQADAVTDITNGN